VVAQRRFGPLIVTVFVALAVVLARLFQVQVVEHEVWAQQALGLVRTGKTVPGLRGAILDRNGRVLVHDEKAYQIELCYRDFRRGHALGILAHARSAIEMRAVTIAAALEHKTEWTAALLHVSQHDLDEFALGRAWTCGGIVLPAAQDKERELCSRRAIDVRYYATQLLDPDLKEKEILRKLEEPARSKSFLELIAAHRGITPDGLLARVQSAVEEQCSELARLSETLPFETPTADAPARTPFEHLIATLETVRSELEDDAADELFRGAAGFEAGEVATGTLQSAFDLDWIAGVLRWDRARLDAWTATRRAQRDARIERGLLPRMLVQVEIEEPERAPERLLDELARLWRTDPNRDAEGRPPSWRKTDELVVLSELDTLFAGARLPRGADVPDLVLPFQDEELRATPFDVDVPWKIVGMLSDLAGKDGSDADEPLREPRASEFWAAHADARAGLESPEARMELARIVRALDRRHAAAVDRLIASLAAARAGGDGSTGRMCFSEDRLRHAASQEKYVLIDRGNRPLRLFGEPPYDLVLRIARHPATFCGFEVCETTRRMQLVKDKAGEPCAGLLIGDVRKPHLREMLEQSADERRLDELRWQTSRSDEEELEIRDLVARVQRSDEWTGGWGLEDYLDRDLRAVPGWVETQGLEEHARTEGGARAQAARDGRTVVLTIDSDLQLAAQDVLAAPRVPNDDRTDRRWFENPVGAILLVTSEGDVLAAASAPEKSGFEHVPGRDKEREYRRERTLQMPTFQPPGSVFKPFVAAYALGRKGFEPSQTFECVDPGHSTGKFETMHCLGYHYSPDLRMALTVSCNAYFAQLGARFSVDDATDMMRTFGFDEPTGVKCFEGEGRSGLIEQVRPINARFLRDMKQRSAQLQFANGLAVVQATPMQIARAMAGIVTGSLPDVRLIEKVGDREVPHAARPLGIDERSLAFVRSALGDVVTKSGGSASNKGVDAASLGFSFACKTGSADYKLFEITSDSSAADESRAEKGKMRKHTWVAGFFPAENPRAILVVYLHDVAETSSHTAVYLAAQFLQTEAVKAFVAKVQAEAAR
jgi:cell division protein FtsI/penicillin-binding protein 2